MKRLASRRVQNRSVRRRRRHKQLDPLAERLKQLADRAKRAAAELPPGKERESLLLKAAQAENVLEFVRLLGRQSRAKGAEAYQLSKSS